MRKTMISACAGLLAACGTPVMSPAPALAPPHGDAASAASAALAGSGRYAEAVALLEEAARRRPDAALLGNLGYAYYLDGRRGAALAALERACLLEPSSALSWERLAALLEALGETDRALAAMRHARMLREQAARAERGGAGPSGAAGTAGGADAPAAAPAAAAGLWPSDMARVEIRPLHAGLVEVARVQAPAAQHAAAKPLPAAPARLEVSNGNGVRGMAAAVAQRLRAAGMDVVRLSNTVPFNVEETRVEFRSGGEPRLRIVLGKDLAPEIKKPPAVSRRQAP